MTHDDIALAAEYALGLLEDDELRVARERVLADRAFAAEVVRWQDWLATLLAAYPDVAPAAAMEARVAALAGEPAAFGTVTPIAPAPRGAWRWGAIAVAVAAVLVFALVLGPVRAPPPVPVPASVQERPLLAALAVQDGQSAPGRAALAAAVDRGTGEVRIAGDPATPRRRSAQLWAIGTNGTPVPLGLLAADGPTRIVVAPAARALLAAGTTLAISIEPTGGSPTGVPTGPVVAAGALAAG